MKRHTASMTVRRAYAEQRQIPRRDQAEYFRATAGRSRADAIHSFCKECSGFDVRAAIDCEVRGCPLWPFRPRRASTPYSDPDSEEIVPSSAPNPQKTAVCEKDIEGAG